MEKGLEEIGALNISEKPTCMKLHREIYKSKRGLCTHQLVRLNGSTCPYYDETKRKCNYKIKN